MSLAKIKNKKGFSLVEALIFSLIVVIVVLTFYKTIASGSKVLRDARAKIAASQVANEIFETIRNIPYENLTVGADGEIFLDRNVTKSNIQFNVIVSIKYINDTYDDMLMSGPDERPNDYKEIAATVSWKNGSEVKKLIMYTHIAPPGTEELYDGGILSIDIRQSNGNPVSGANVQIINVDTGVVLNNETTLGDGKVYLIGYNPGNFKYKIIVRKDGYYPVDTLPPMNETPYNPTDVHASVVLAGIWQKTIIFDPIANLNLKTIDPLGNNIGNIVFGLEGGRKLGDLYGYDYYSYKDDSVNTNAVGSFELANQNPGPFFFNYGTDTANDSYKFWKVSPAYDQNNTKFYINSGSNQINAILLPKNVPSLFLRVTDDASLPDTNPPIPNTAPLSGAKVTVSNESLAYSKDQITDQFGQVYFPVDEATVVPLQSGQYKVSVQYEGYHQKESEITFDVSALVENDIVMVQN